MSIESVMDATRAGLAFERARLEAASRNIAAANVPLPADAAATRADASGFGAHLGGAAINDVPVAMRKVHEPGNPMADADGMVHYPATDLVQEMTTLMTASRGYEANVRAFNLLRGMLMKAIDIGAK